jgi:mRNA interferase MazF
MKTAISLSDTLYEKAEQTASYMGIPRSKLFALALEEFIYGIPYGSEPGYRRPVIIIQNDFFNNSKINTTIVAPLSTNLLLVDVPGNIFINKTDSKLTKDSVVLVSQIGVIDKERLIEKVSKIDGAAMEMIEKNIMFILGMKIL